MHHVVEDFTRVVMSWLVELRVAATQFVCTLGKLSGVYSSDAESEYVGRVKWELGVS